MAYYSEVDEAEAAPSCGLRLLWLSETPAVPNRAVFIWMITMSGFDINPHYSK